MPVSFGRTFSSRTVPPTVTVLATRSRHVALNAFCTGETLTLRE
jgi:hypothetical protein